MSPNSQLRRCCRIATMTLFTLLGITAANAQITLTGKDVVSACLRPDPDWINFCNGYVQAVIDSMHRPGDGLCIPTGTSRATLVGLVMSRLTNTSELQQLNGAAATYYALLQMFPCSQKR